MTQIGGYNLSPDVARLNPDVGGNTADLKAMSPSKFHNVRTEAKGMVFQSGKEAAGVANLILLDEQHVIFGLRLQVRFPLPGGVHYVADAVYAEVRDGKLCIVVKDFKGYKTQEFKLKAKLFAEKYGQEIETE